MKRYGTWWNSRKARTRSGCPCAVQAGRKQRQVTGNWVRDTLLGGKWVSLWGAEIQKIFTVHGSLFLVDLYCCLHRYLSLRYQHWLHGEVTSTVVTSRDPSVWLDSIRSSGPLRWNLSASCTIKLGMTSKTNSHPHYTSVNSCWIDQHNGQRHTWGIKTNTSGWHH